MKLPSLILVIMMALAAGGCADRVDSGERSRGECEQLRAHVVDLQLGAVGGKLDADELARHRANLEASMGEPYIDRCAEERSTAYVSCANPATSLGELRACD